MITYAQLARACRRNDQAADASPDLDSLLAELGVDPIDAARAAEQRGLRLEMALEGMPPVRASEPVAVRVENPERMHALSTAWLDGLAAGLRVAKE